MKHFIQLTDYKKADIYNIFNRADDLKRGKYNDCLKGKTVVMFLPDSSIRTRITFEKGIKTLGGQAILFPPKTLDKRENIKDVIGYLNNWADAAVVRHNDLNRIKEMAEYADFPVINAMTDVNHPCEVVTDMYSLSKIRTDFTKDNYLFAGPSGNIGLAWKEASNVMGFELTQSCPKGYEIEGVTCIHNLRDAMKGKDIICTDSFSENIKKDFTEYQITTEIMELANENACLNPCPPFFRGEEVSDEVINSTYFVGYEFKSSLLEIQQAILIYCMS